MFFYMLLFNSCVPLRACSHKTSVKQAMTRITARFFPTRFLCVTQGQREKIDDTVLNLLAVVGTIIFDKETDLSDVLAV